MKNNPLVEKGHDKGQERVIIYCFFALGLVILELLLLDSQWKSDALFHTILESIAAVLAILVGTVALIRFYSRPSNIFLFLGGGFLGTAFLDAYHAVVTSSWIYSYLPSIPATLIPWSWIASRLFLAIMLFVGFLAYLKEKKQGEEGLINPGAVYLWTTLFTLMCFVVFAFVPLPQAYWPEWHFFHRPQELLASLFFLLALIGYLREGQWRTSVFHHWLILSLIVNLVGQTVFMPHSHELFDAQFDMAHVLKKVSYICVLVGLLINMLFLYRQADLSTRLQHEIQERIRAEEKVTIANKQLIAIFEGVDDVIYVADPQSYELLYVNPTFKKIWGEQPLGNKCYKSLQNRDSPCPFCTNDKIFGEFLNQSYIWEFQNEVNAQWYRCVDKAIKWSDERMVRFEVASNITEQKLAEQERVHYRENLERDVKRRTRELNLRTQELEQANKDLEGFSYSVSHDLRAPLRAIYGFVSILKEEYEEKLDQEGHRLLQIIVDNTHKMGRLIDDILSFSRASRLTLQYVDIDMNALVKEVWEDLEAERNATEYQLNCSNLPDIKGDKNALRQVWQNLLANAIKFSKGRTPAIIEVSAEFNEQEICYRVKDNGVGFNQEYSDKLFILFQRLHSMDEFEGTGVGLALIKRFVQKHGGKVEAQGVLNKGATFSFILPK